MLALHALSHPRTVRSQATHSLLPILPVGTAVVALVDLRGSDGLIIFPRGTPGVITALKADALTQSPPLSATEFSNPPFPRS